MCKFHVFLKTTKFSSVIVRCRVGHPPSISCLSIVPFKPPLLNCFYKLDLLVSERRDTMSQCACGHVSLCHSFPLWSVRFMSIMFFSWIIPIIRAALCFKIYFVLRCDTSFILVGICLIHIFSCLSLSFFSVITMFYVYPHGAEFCFGNTLWKAALFTTIPPTLHGL